MRRAAPVRIALRRSRFGIAFVVCIHAATLGLLLNLPLAAAALGVAIAAVLASGGWQLYRQTFPRTRTLILFPEHRLQTGDATGKTIESDVLSASVVLPGLIIVRHRVRGERLSRTLILLADMGDAEELRRLRIALRWRRPAEEISSP